MANSRFAIGSTPKALLGKKAVIQMLNYAQERAREALATVGTVVLATSGPAGVQVGEFACESVDLNLYLLVPQTSDHLFNLEQEPRVALLSDGWELKGRARPISAEETHPELRLLKAPNAPWSVLIGITASQLQIRRRDGWGAAETI